MDEKKMFDEVRQLCLANGLAIDRIAHDCNINQNLVAKFFMEVMQKIKGTPYAQTPSSPRCNNYTEFSYIYASR